MKWQTIESVPKGDILICDNDDCVFAAYSFGGDTVHIVQGFHSNRVYNASYWQPLPDPPTHLTDFEYSGKTKKVEGPFQYDGLR